MFLSAHIFQGFLQVMFFSLAISVFFFVHDAHAVRGIQQSHSQKIIEYKYSQERPSVDLNFTYQFSSYQDTVLNPAMIFNPLESLPGYNSQSDNSDVELSLFMQEQNSNLGDYNLGIVSNNFVQQSSYTISVNQDGAEGDTNLLVIVKSEASLPKLDAMCNLSNQNFKQQKKQLIKAGIKQEFASDCNLTGLCESIFRNAIFGVYGAFKLEQIEQLEEFCLPGEIDYVEGDQDVFKIGAESNFPIGLSNPKIFIAPQQSIVHKFSVADSIFRIPDSVPSEPPKELGEAAEVTEQYLTLLEGLTNDPTVVQDQLQISEIIGSPGYKNWPLPEGLWNLDRVDQRQLPLDDLYTFGGNGYTGTGKGATIYVVDSGIRSSHIEFYNWQEQKSRVGAGFDAVDNDFDASDCDGHGTHVASIAVGRGVGLAKEADIVGVRVLNCSGEGFTGRVVAGLDWIGQNAKKPAIITLSLGLDRQSHNTKALEEAIKKLVADGIVVVVASGNGAQNAEIRQSACDISPAHMEQVITVGATNLEHKFGPNRKQVSSETVYRFGNVGECVDIFAPGVDIYAACGGTGRCEEVRDVSYTWQSGTSMAVPHVAAAAAILMAEVGHQNITPHQVKQILTQTATTNQIQDTTGPLLEGETNRLLYINVQEMLQKYQQITNRK